MSGGAIRTEEQVVSGAIKQEEHKSIKLGWLVKCKITGYQGVVSVRTEYLHNSPRVAIMPRELDKNGKIQSEMSVDEMQVEVLSTEQVITPPPFEQTAFYFGQRVQDKMSGLTGRVYGISYYLNGCIRIGLQPPVEKNNKMPGIEWIPQGSLESIEPETPKKVAEKKEKQKKASTGGPMRDAPRSMSRHGY